MKVQQDKRSSLTNNCFIIGEVAQAHDGSLGIAHSYIDALAKVGVNAIKFQTHIAEAESSKQEPFRVNFSYEDKTRYDYWQRMQFTKEQWWGLKKHCDEADIEFISSPFSCLAVDYLNDIGVNKFKVGSGEICNYLMLEKIAKTGKEIILSSGMSSFEELDAAISIINKYHNKISVLQCTTKYPTGSSDVGLNVITELKDRYHCPVGLSDHSGRIFPSIAAVALGAKIIECHVTFDKMMFGPDASSSLTISEFNQMVEGIRFVENSVKNPVDKNDVSSFEDVRKIFQKSLAVNKDLKKDHIIEFEDLEAKKPHGYGIPASEHNNVIGKKLNKNINQYSFINWTDFDED